MKEAPLRWQKHNQQVKNPTKTIKRQLKREKHNYMSANANKMTKTQLR